MEPARLTELRLTAFKTFRDESLPLSKLTLLIGGNAVGKSNALDGLVALARLLSGLPFREALDGTRKAPSPVRGGVQGCLPAGENSFAVGCTIEDGEFTLGLDARLTRDVEITRASRQDGTEPPDVAGKGKYNVTVAVTDTFTLTATLKRGTDDPVATSAQVDATTTNPSPRLGLMAEVEKLYPGTSPVTERLLGALDRVLLLTPEPDRMRGYVPLTDTELQTDASNLSATIESMRNSDPASFGKLEQLAAGLSKGRISGLKSITTSVGDVQLSFREGEAEIPARLASDGTLRLLAFGSALLSSPPTSPPQGAEQLIMIEEIERGLYPAQAGLMLGLLEQELEPRPTSLLCTTHSPALLSALHVKHHPHVIVCSRSPETGLSRLTPLTELPGYAQLIAEGGLGEAVVGDGLDRAHEERLDTWAEIPAQRSGGRQQPAAR